MSYVFDASGQVVPNQIIESDDGGIYRLTASGSNRTWESLNGNLAITETNSIAYDSLSNIILSGNFKIGPRRPRPFFVARPAIVFSPRE